MRRLLLIGGLALALSGCAAYGPDYGYGYGSYGSAYPYGSGYGTDYGYASPSYGYSAPAYGYSAPYYGYNPGPSVNFGFFGGGGDRDRFRRGDEGRFRRGDEGRFGGGDFRRPGDGGHDFRGQARAMPTPAPRVSAPGPAPRVARPPGGGVNVGKNYGGPEGGPK
jgi:hypothetical protein